MAGIKKDTNHMLQTVSEPLSAKGGIGKESKGFAAAELASMGISLGVVAIMDKVIPESMMKTATNAVSKVCIEPYLDTIEKAISKCKLKECQVDESKTREERACRLAKGLVVFGTAWAASLIAKTHTRRWINDKNGIKEQVPVLPKDAPILRKIYHNLPFVGMSKEERMIFAADEGAHIGSFLLLNTKAADVTENNITATSSFLEKHGVSKQKAKEVSSMMWVWEAPNAIGMLAGLGAIAGKHSYGWPRKHEHQSFVDIAKGRAQSMFTNHSKA